MIHKCTYICTILHYHSCSPSNIQGWHEQTDSRSATTLVSSSEVGSWAPVVHRVRCRMVLVLCLLFFLRCFNFHTCLFIYLLYEIDLIEISKLDTWNVQVFFEEPKPLLTDFWTIFCPSVSDWSSECEGSVPEDFRSETPGPHLANQRKASQNELRKNMQWSWVSSKRTWWKMLKGVAIVPSNWWRFRSPRTINVHALSWDQAPNGGACRKGMQYPSECLKRGNEVHFWRLWGHGVCMVDHLQNKNRRGPSFWELPSTRAIS